MSLAAPYSASVNCVAENAKSEQSLAHWYSITLSRYELVGCLSELSGACVQGACEAHARCMRGKYKARTSEKRYHVALPKQGFAANKLKQLFGTSKGPRGSIHLPRS